MFKLKDIKDIKIFSILPFEETGLVRHGFTTRVGGVSSPPYVGLNLGFTVGDGENQVRKNRKLITSALNIPLEKLVAAKQIHQDKVAIVTKKDQGKGALDYQTALEGTDALITAEKNLPLSTFYADCVPLFILDQKTPAIGLAHAGWKGTALKIGAKTIKKMGDAFGTKPKNCIIGIGPSIGPCCYQVDDFVRGAFQKEFDRLESIFKPSSEGHWQLNLWAGNEQALVEIGVPKEQIFVSSLCTSCRLDLFFSYRKENGLTGRMAALMMLKG